MTDSQSYTAFVGTYADDESDGVYSYRLHAGTGELEPIGAAVMGERPTFLDVHPNGQYLYAVNEVEGGSITAGVIDPESGTLTRLNQRSSGGDGPCYCSVDATGRYVLAAHYGDGTVSMLPIEDDGRLRDPSDVVEHDPTDFGRDSSTTARAHSITPGPENRFAYALDLGLDAVVVYEMDLDAGRLHRASSVSVEPGSGPRHLDFHPEGDVAYVLNELESTMIAYERDARTGELEEIETVRTIPDAFDGENNPADVHVHPSGRWVFCSNRGHDSVATFEIDETGRLELIDTVSTGGEWPRNFAIDPTGTYLFAENRRTDDVVGFRITDGGRLEATGVVTEVQEPICMRFRS